MSDHSVPCRPADLRLRLSLVPRTAAFLALVLSLALARAAGAQVYEVVHAFTVPPAAPVAGLILATDSNFYGTTQGGGGASAGTVFRSDAAGTITVLHTFNNDDGAAPLAGLFQAVDGSLYGTTSIGGANGMGTVFKMDLAGNFTTLHHFAGAEGANPYGGVVQGADGKIYGTTEYGGLSNLGTVFQMDLLGAVTTLHSFDGTDGVLPYAGLVRASDNKFYGTTASGGSGSVGTIFRIDSAGSFATLHFFAGTDGSGPRADLIQASDGNLWGTTYGGGAHSFGTIFHIATTGASFASVHDFTSTDGNASGARLFQAADTKLYGLTEVGGTNDMGTAFHIDLAGTFLSIHSFAGADGSQPVSSLVASGGNLYGTTMAGGAIGQGTVFRMTTAGAVTTLHSFGGVGSGSQPSARLVQGPDGLFYGTTYTGGAANLGTVFKMDAAGVTTVLHEFAGTDGASPLAALVHASDGKFYGTTSNGGVPSLGTVFRIDSAGTFEKLHEFNDTDGSDPISGLVQAADTNLYGTTQFGGTNNMGTAFRLTLAGVLTKIHDFAGPDGAYPAGAMIQPPDGKLYGTTWAGGASSDGNIFRMTTAGATSSVQDFDGAGGGQFAFGGLVLATDGSMYGTTRLGGANQDGTLYRFTVNGALTFFQVIHSFAGSDGLGPIDGVIQASNGKLYGAAYSGGANGKGNVFSSDLSGNVTTVHDFSGGDGQGAAAAPIESADGRLYGITNQGGPGAAGVVYRITSCVTPVASSNSPVCTGQILRLFATTVPGATYQWTGPNGFSSALQNPTIAAATAAATGTYSVTAHVGACDSGAATTSVTVAACAVIPTALAVDAGGDGVLAPGETVTVSPSWMNTTGSPVALTGSASAFTGPGTATYGIPDAAASYGSIAGGATASCASATANCYSLSLSTPATRPLVHWDASFVETPSTGSPKTWTVHVGDSFTDVPRGGVYRFVETLLHLGVTGGCGTTTYCPNTSVTRQQMAVFLLTSSQGSSYSPPACVTPVFTDVPCSSGFAKWIDDLAGRGVTAGCGTGIYCPTDPVTRAQMAVFLLKMHDGPSYVPPACVTPTFTDVPCSSGFARWVDELALRGITAGCGGGKYCPATAVTRGQMAVFLTTTFALSMYGP